MTRVTELTPLLKSLSWALCPPRCPSASPWPVVSSWTTPHSWRSFSATRSTAALIAASNFDSTMPVSRRPAAWMTSTGQRQLPWTAGCWTPYSRWSFWTSTSTCCWLDRPAWARVSWLRLSAILPSVPDTPSASSTPTTSSRPWLKPGSTTRWIAPSGPSSGRFR